MTLVQLYRIKPTLAAVTSLKTADRIISNSVSGLHRVHLASIYTQQRNQQNNNHKNIKARRRDRLPQYTSYNDDSRLAQQYMKITEQDRTDQKKDILVYEATSNTYLWGASAVFYGGSVVAMAFLPFNVSKLLSTGEPVLLDFGNTLLVTLLINMWIIVQPAVLRIFTKRYIIRGYFNEAADTYTFVMQSWFLLLKKVKVKPRQVQVASVFSRNFLTNSFTSFYANGKPYFVIVDRFKLPYYYNHLMGYE